MYSKSKFNFKKFFIALLSMLTAITLAFSVACKKNDPSTDTPDDDSTSTETTTTVTDYQLIKNGDFEFNTKDDSSFPYSSSINWARSLYTSVTSAPSSTGTSGIIDTADEKFTKLESKNKPSENPKTPFAFGLVENTYDADDEELRVNPQADGTKILMINNKKNGEGTAQYYRASSSISVPTPTLLLSTGQEVYTRALLPLRLPPVLRVLSIPLMKSLLNLNLKTNRAKTPKLLLLSA